MNTLFKRMYLLSLCIGMIVLSSQSNPLLYSPFSEIVIINESHWSIELDCKYLDLHQTGQTDSITLFSTNMRVNGLIDKELLKKCVSMETIDTNNICVITEKNFSDVKLWKGEVFL